MRSLLGAVDALAQGLAQDDVDTLPAKLVAVWEVLRDHRKGPFFAAEEKLLRVLLKHMAGPSPTAERLRRYPPVWDILRALFPLVLLKPLAKALADRRFVRTLRQTLKDLATPQQEGGGQTKGTDSDVEMPDVPDSEHVANAGETASLNVVSFNLAVQRQVGGCLQTAEAVFEAVRVLLQLCEARSRDEPLYSWVGGEHVKSMFYTSATETMAILSPWLSVCGLALDRRAAVTLKEQASWLSTFAALWELHMHNAADVSEVATHLFGPAARLLGKITGVPRPVELGVEQAVQEQWARDLHRFLTRYLVLEARAAFLNRGRQDVLEIQTALSVSSPSAHITFPVLFSLACRPRLELAGRAPSKDYEIWVQAVFDAILQAAKVVNRDNGQTALRSIAEVAAERGATLSASSLRTVCKDYALHKNAFDWSLLLSIVQLNPDVFLVSDEGQQLLGQVLERAGDSVALATVDFDRAARFVVMLADGYALARDLPGFVKLWLQHLASGKFKHSTRSVWAQKALADAVAQLIQTSLTTTQLVGILEWLSLQTQRSESTARIHVLEAVSRGLSQDEFIDAANMRIFEGVFQEEYSKKEPPAISARRWTVASRAIASGTSADGRNIWSKVQSDIKRVLQKCPIDREDTFAAFKCCTRTWLANAPGSDHEAEAATLLCSFAERLENEDGTAEQGSSDSSSAVSQWSYVFWILSDAPQMLGPLLEKDSPIIKGILSTLSVPKNADPVRVEHALAVSHLLLEREPSVSNRKLMDLSIDTVLSMLLRTQSRKPGPSLDVAVGFLLAMPVEIPSRSQREAAMKSSVAHFTGDVDKGVTPGSDHCQRMLSLMVKLMERPTYYEGMSFSDLEFIGRRLSRTHQHLDRRSKETPTTDDIMKDRGHLTLLLQLAKLSVRQMTSASPGDREKFYLRGAVSLLQSHCQGSDVVPRIVLLQAFISVAQGSPAAKQLDEENPLNLESLISRLVQIATPIVLSGERKGAGLLALLVALDALSDLDTEAVRPALSGAVPSLLKASNSLLAGGDQAGWEIRTFLATHFFDVLASPFRIKTRAEAPGAASEGRPVETSDSAATLDKAALLRYVDAVVRSADERRKLGYLEELLREDNGEQDELGRLLVIYRLIQHLKGSRLPEDIDQFDLAKAHYMLCDRLENATVPAHFLFTSKALHLLIDQNPACTTQFNIGHTLGCVATICAQPTTPALISSSPDIYPSLCRLVAILIKRHRKRLEDSFHILVDTLQALLRLLLSRPQQDPAIVPSSEPTTTRHHAVWEQDAKLFSGLLTLVCEPTAGSVSSSSAHTAGALDSEKDRAKRFAGEFMHYVLTQYIRLQVAHVVPHGVRVALEPGMYAIMDITTRGGRGIMSASMDASLRAVLREMYKRYERFGKWTGV